MVRCRCLILAVFMFLSSTGKGQETIVNVNGSRFHIKYTGNGDVTVIFECGMGMDLTTWRIIEDSVAAFSRVFMYDRLGIGKSGSTSRERTIPSMVSELIALLDHENISPPYVLVPHSMGSYIARYFINQYPDLVKGVLLLDPSAETYYDSLTPEGQKNDQEMGTSYYNTQPIGAQNEWKNYLPNRKYMSGLHIPDRIPVILVSTNSWNMTPSQTKIIENQSNAKHIILDGQHDVYNIYPDTIVSLIKNLVRYQD